MVEFSISQGEPLDQNDLQYGPGWNITEIEVVFTIHLSHIL